MLLGQPPYQLTYKTQGLDYDTHQPTIRHNDFLRLPAFQIFLDGLGCQRRGLDRFIPRLSRDRDPVPYFAVDLHRDFDLIFLCRLCVKFGPLLLVDRVWPA